jgi:SAM-dependent methyltransferase
VGIDRDPRLVEAAKTRVAHLPWVDVVQADALGYAADISFDAVHCRLVLMHQHAPDAFLAHLIALTRPGGRVAVQEYDLDGLPCFPAFGSFERMIDAGLRAIKHVGSDPYAGRKLLDRFARVELSDVRLEAQTPFVPFVDARMEVVLGAFAVVALRPPALDEFGLVAAIRDQASQHETAEGLQVFVTAPETLPALPAAVEVAAFRIAAEALTNVSRHAHAHTCRISLDVSDVLILQITDDGTDMPSPSRTGVGLSSMRERAAELVRAIDAVGRGEALFSPMPPTDGTTRGGGRAGRSTPETPAAFPRRSSR